MKQRIFNKGEVVHTLLTATNTPNTFIPVKGIIKDIEWDQENPKYLIKVLKFYDSIIFLKKHLFDMNFWHSSGTKPRVLRLKRGDFKTVIELKDRLDQPDEERFYIYTYSLLTLKTKVEMRELFNKMQYFMISKKLSELKELTTRPFYRGVLKIDTEAEYLIMLKDFLKDMFDRKNEDIDQYLKSL